MQYILSFFIFLSICLAAWGAAPEKIKDFHLSNYKDDGTQNWQIQGKQAFVYDNYVDIEEMEGSYHSVEDIISVKSQKARMDKVNFDVSLKKNVYIENKQGIKLFTDSLNWSRANSKIDTCDRVRIQQDKMQIKARGMNADTGLKTVDFKEEVEVIFPDKEGEVIVITCQGPLEIKYNEETAVFYNKVRVKHTSGELFADKATVFFDQKEKKIIKIISQGNVKIIREESLILAQTATYLGGEERIVLEGDPRVVYFSQGKEIGFH